MSKKLRRWFFSVFIAVLVTFLLVIPCLAINPPDSLSVDSVYVFRNCRETGDQLYLIKFTITYSTNQSTSATYAYIVRLMNGSTELGAVAPYAYYNDGYGDGVVAIYFDATNAPVWEGDYTVILEGNPMTSWNGTRPSTSFTGFDEWNDNSISTTQSLVSTRILTYALQLKAAWEIDLVETTAAGTVLTTYGEDYFMSIVPYLMQIAPYAFAASVQQPTYPDITKNYTYAEELAALSEGTVADIGTPIGNALGISRGNAAAVWYYGAVIVALILICRMVNSYKPLMLLLAPFVCVGWAVGVPLDITVYAGLIAFFLLLFEILYKPASD